MFDIKQIFGLDILVSSNFFRKKLEEIAIFQFLPGVPEEIHFFRKKPNPENKYENLMMLHIWILCGKDLFNMGIYRLIQTKIYLTVCISMYVKPNVPHMHVTDTTATPNGHQMAVITWDRSIDVTLAFDLEFLRSNCISGMGGPIVMERKGRESIGFPDVKHWGNEPTRCCADWGSFDIDLWPWIFKVKLYLGNGRRDCHGTKRMGVDRMPWCKMSDVKHKGNESTGCCAY